MRTAREFGQRKPSTFLALFEHVSQEDGPVRLNRSNNKTTRSLPLHVRNTPIYNSYRMPLCSTGTSPSHLLQSVHRSGRTTHDWCFLFVFSLACCISLRAFLFTLGKRGKRNDDFLFTPRKSNEFCGQNVVGVVGLVVLVFLISTNCGRTSNAENVIITFVDLDAVLKRVSWALVSC